AGMSNFDALKAATVNPAIALNLNAGTIEAGKLADLIMLDGDPLADIANTTKVRRVIANGRVYELEELLSGKMKPAPQPAGGVSCRFAGSQVRTLRVLQVRRSAPAGRPPCGGRGRLI